MKTTKFKQRVANARRAFFAEDNSDANDSLTYRNEFAVAPNEKFEAASCRTKAAEMIFKQVVFFFPGTVILFFLSIGFTLMSIITLVKPSERVTVRWLFSSLVVFLTAVLMTWLGLGDVQKPKHLIIPVSIIAVGVVSGAFVAGVLMTISKAGKYALVEGYLFYLLPLALIVPFLAKGWVDRNE